MFHLKVGRHQLVPVDYGQIVMLDHWFFNRNPDFKCKLGIYSFKNKYKTSLCQTKSIRRPDLALWTKKPSVIFVYPLLPSGTQYLPFRSQS